MSGYEYDIFFSYKRDKQSNHWHEKVVSKVEFWLRKELNRSSVDIFFDTEEIKTGDQWKNKIEDSLKRSKCLVPILSPDYFHSSWCRSEWETFREREKMLHLPTGGLIIPAIYHDGEHFPQEAKNIQSMDFTEYNSNMVFFWKSEDGYNFEKRKLKAFAGDIAKRIKKAPDYKKDFPIVIVDPVKLSTRAPIKRGGKR